MSETQFDVAIIGAGYGGLSAGYELALAGKRVVILEADTEVGGLAGTFQVGDTKLEKFYHHWFTNDVHVLDLVKDLDLEGNILLRPTRTGMYFANNFFRLSTPKDLLAFTPLGLIDRVRLGLLALRARKVSDWKQLESLTAAEWLTSMGGKTVYKIVWEPLLRGKFGKYADEISAVWFWNKLKLRGGSRGSAGQEMLAYYQGGFAALAESLRDKLVELGVDVRLGSPVHGFIERDGAVVGVQTPTGPVQASKVLVTTPIKPFIEISGSLMPSAYAAELNRIGYIGNVCLVLQLDRSLSDTYWLNVNDPTFPYVAVIEHTNFEPSETYGGRKIVYLSKYLPTDEELYTMSDEEVYRFSLPHIKRMFPAFEEAWVLQHNVWRAEFSQPIVVRNYSKLIPSFETPIPNVHLCTMAQVYPEDRGTNYAIRDGRIAGKKMVEVVERHG